MSEPAKQVSVVDDPAATRSVLGMVPFSDALSLVKAIEWLLAAPQLFSAQTGERHTNPEVRFTTNGPQGLVQLVLFNRKPSPGISPYGGPKDSDLVLIVTDKVDRL